MGQSTVLLQFSVANAHSHNDYQQKKPFTTAFSAEFGSMETDIFLFHDSLYVGHEQADIQRHRSLKSLYLDSLDYYLEKRNGQPYPETGRHLQLLIELKTGAEPTLKRLVLELEKYPRIIHSKNISIVITGNRPSLDTWNQYPYYICFDGDASKQYPAALLPRLGMMSGDLEEFIEWNGLDQIREDQKQILRFVINYAHQQGKKIRFWDSPDFPQAWSQLIGLGIDWINTDHINQLKEYLEAKDNPGKLY
jgi:alkaline phosphatase